MVEPPGTAPGSEPLITCAFIVIVPKNVSNIEPKHEGVKKAGERLSRPPFGRFGQVHAQQGYSRRCHEHFYAEHVKARRHETAVALSLSKCKSGARSRPFDKLRDEICGLEDETCGLRVGAV